MRFDQHGSNARGDASGEECTHAGAFADPMLAGILPYRITVIVADCVMTVYEDNTYHVVIVAAWAVSFLQNMIPR